MAIESTKFNGEPILLLRFIPPSDPRLEARQLHQALLGAATGIGRGRLYLVSDLSQTDLWFDDVLVGMAEISKITAEFDLFPVMVGTSEMVQLIVAATHQQQYGGQGGVLFPTVDEAVDHIRSLIAVAQD